MHVFVKIVRQVKQSYRLIVIAVGGGQCNEAACVPRMNNQHPSEVMGGSRIRGSRRVCVKGGGSWWGGGGTDPPGTLHSVKRHG